MNRLKSTLHLIVQPLKYKSQITAPPNSNNPENQIWEYTPEDLEQRNIEKLVTLLVFGKTRLALMIGAILTVIIDRLIVQRVIANAIETHSAPRKS